MTHAEWMIRQILWTMNTGHTVTCQVCYDRRWIPVCAQTFIECYGMRLDAGMECSLPDKIRECSEFVGHCTCSS